MTDESRLWMGRTTKVTADVHSRLVWPQGKPRTPQHRRKQAPFRMAMSQAVTELVEELRKLGGRYIVVSTDVDGYMRRDVWRPYSDAPDPEDPGVAVYFDLDGEQFCIACDCWDLVEDNVRAIGKTVEAQRGLERWGAIDTMSQAFQGFRHALPAAGDDWRSVLGLSDDTSPDALKARYRELAASAHPDRGGSEHEMSRINQAMDAARKEIGA